MHLLSPLTMLNMSSTLNTYSLSFPLSSSILHSSWSVFIQSSQLVLSPKHSSNPHTQCFIQLHPHDVRHHDRAHLKQYLW